MQEMQGYKAATVGKWGHHHNIANQHFDEQRVDFHDSSLSGLHLSAGQ